MFDELLPRIIAAHDADLLEEIADYCERSVSNLFLESMVSNKQTNKQKRNYYKSY